ncbi:hypothetical protein ACS0TY_003145 [Phlomoides rotata]
MAEPQCQLIQKLKENYHFKMVFVVIGIMSTLLIYGVLQELVETTSSAPPFVQTGCIYGVHCLQGEVRPGIRWLKQQVSGTDTIHEIELVEDRGNPGHSWIVRFKDINTVEQESGEPVGTVVNIFNSGASDLLQVKLNSLRKIPDQIGNSEIGAGDSGPLVWLPFVEAIVPSKAVDDSIERWRGHRAS